MIVSNIYFGRNDRVRLKKAENKRTDEGFFEPVFDLYYTNPIYLSDV